MTNGTLSLSSFLSIPCLLNRVELTHSVNDCDRTSSFSNFAVLFEMYIGGMLCESNKREMTKPGEDTAAQLDDGLSYQEQFQLGRKPGRRTGAQGGGGGQRY